MGEASASVEVTQPEGERSAAAAHEEEEPAPEFSLLRLVGINLPALNYGLVSASVGVLVLPQEAERMFGERRSLYLALMLALTGFSQLVCPMVGYASDRTRSSMGKRMPYILFGDAAALVSPPSLALSLSLSLPLSLSLALSPSRSGSACCIQIGRRRHRSGCSTSHAPRSGATPT